MRSLSRQGLPASGSDAPLLCGVMKACAPPRLLAAAELCRVDGCRSGDQSVKHASIRLRRRDSLLLTYHASSRSGSERRHRTQTLYLRNARRRNLASDSSCGNASVWTSQSCLPDLSWRPQRAVGIWWWSARARCCGDSPCSCQVRLAIARAGRCGHLAG